MTDADDRIASLLQEVAETHHQVYRITDGTDDDWASWYAEWLVTLSELPELLGARPVRSHLVHALVELDRSFTADAPADRPQLHRRCARRGVARLLCPPPAGHARRPETLSAPALRAHQRATG